MGKKTVPTHTASGAVTGEHIDRSGFISENRGTLLNFYNVETNAMGTGMIILSLFSSKGSK